MGYDGVMGMQKNLMYITHTIFCSFSCDWPRQDNPDFQTEGEFMLRGGIERYVRTFPEGGFWKARVADWPVLGQEFCTPQKCKEGLIYDFDISWFLLTGNLQPILAFAPTGEELSLRQEARANTRKQANWRNGKRGRCQLQSLWMCGCYARKLILGHFGIFQVDSKCCVCKRPWGLYRGQFKCSHEVWPRFPWFPLQPACVGNSDRTAKFQ